MILSTLFILWVCFSFLIYEWELAYFLVNIFAQMQLKKLVVLYFEQFVPQLKWFFEMQCIIVIIHSQQYLSTVMSRCQLYFISNRLCQFLIGWVGQVQLEGENNCLGCVVSWDDVRIYGRDLFSLYSYYYL
eukprot:TRINITY_DN9805_c0_g1_i5.p2 TRINITY_DN9805_c0_g1~~TRINITY_DN9805_c0_g1_i5.p2  ORF type:complete len:131 (+),score=8.25 TRINITY_DN9805_c0_g1_i5:115-507(+)